MLVSFRCLIYESLFFVTTERDKAEDEQLSHDAIAHRLREDVVSLVFAPTFNLAIGDWCASVIARASWETAEENSITSEQLANVTKLCKMQFLCLLVPRA